MTSGLRALFFLGSGYDDEAMKTLAPPCPDPRIAEGKHVTYDMKPDRNDPTAVGTAQMADAIIAKL